MCASSSALLSGLNSECEVDSIIGGGMRQKVSGNRYGASIR